MGRRGGAEGLAQQFENEAQVAAKVKRGVEADRV